MPLTPHIQTNFNGGEISPIAFGRSDLKRYASGLAILENMMSQKQGGLARRSGTRYVADVKTHADLTILYPFRVSTVANYVVEFGDTYARFYVSRGILFDSDGSTPVEITTPWATADLRELKFIQSADILYVFHPDFEIREIVRTSATSFGLRLFAAKDGPYQPQNTTATRLVSRALTSTATVTATTQDNPVRVTTSPDHGFLTGVSVTMKNVTGMPELDDRTFTITRITNATFDLDGEDGTGYPNPGTAGTAAGWVGVESEDADGNKSVVGINSGLGFLPTDIDRMIRWVESGSTAVTWFTIKSVHPTRAISTTNTATPVNVQTTGNHGFSTGDQVHITGVSGATELNDRTYTVTVTNATNFKLDDTVGDNAGTGGTARDATVANVVIEGPDINSSELTRRTWSLGSWSDTSGWPRTGAFHQGRFWAAGTSEESQTIWSSQTGIFDTFSPTDTDLTVRDDDAITRTIDSNSVHNIYHMFSHTKGLLVMTDAGEWIGGTSGGTFSPLTPSNLGMLIQSSHGSKSNVRPWEAGNAILFAQTAGRKIREFIFQFEDDQFIGNDLTELAEHIGAEVSGEGFVDSAYQEEPEPTLWMVRADGQLCGLTYDRSQKVFAWHRHIIGGTFLGGDAVVESVAVIRDDPADLLWIIVKRTIDGSDVRYIEYVGDKFDATDNEEEAFYVDSGLDNLSGTNNKSTISAITKGSPTTITGTGGGFLERVINGETWHIRDVEGMTQINNNTTGYVVTGSTGSFTIPIDSTSFGDYTKGGIARKVITTLSGLDHLEAEIVKVAGDGAEQADKTVSSGSITLATAASIVYVGLQNTSRLVTLPATPSALGFDVRTSKARIAAIWLMMHKSQGGTAGILNEDAVNIEYDSATALFTGIKELSIIGSHELRMQLEIIADSIQPMNILQIGMEIDVGS